MQTLDFSLMLSNRSVEEENSFFESFEQQQQIRVKRLKIEWLDAWNRLLQFGLNPWGACPDLSEIGTTWLGSFDTMEALYPFSGQEIYKVGGTKRFLPATWQSCVMKPSQTVVGIPWTMDIRVVLYRRDWLQKAGIGEENAFSDIEHFNNTLCGLEEAGYVSPLGMTTRQTVTRMLHDLACWIWDAGGEIRSDNGREMLISRPEGLSGLRAYFGLNKFLEKKDNGQEEPEVLQSFLKGKTAVAIVSDLNYHWLRIGEKNEAIANLGIAKLMKVPFLGGTTLGIWRYSTHVDAALKLIECLTSADTGQVLYENYLTTPANLDAIAQSTLSQDPFYPVIQKSLLTGRTLHSGYRWGGIEARLIPVVEGLWQDLRSNPRLEIGHEVEKRFTALCTRLEQTILAV